MATHNARPAAPGSTCRISHANTSPPWRAPVATSGIASTKDATITHPSTPDRTTDRNIPRGTLCAACTVSSAVWAEASKPVTV